jgi:hypothetical protein
MDGKFKSLPMLTAGVCSMVELKRPDLVLKYFRENIGFVIKNDMSRYELRPIKSPPSLAVAEKDADKAVVDRIGGPNNRVSNNRSSASQLRLFDVDMIPDPVSCSTGKVSPLQKDVIYCSELYCTVLLHCTVLYCTVLHCIVL